MNVDYKNFLTALILLLTCSVNSQTLAITELGDTIYVYDNGVWSFELTEEMPELNELGFLESDIAVDTSAVEFKYSESAKKEVENKNKSFKIKYDSNEWKRVPPATINDEAEFAFQSKTTDIWCLVISEEIPIKPEVLLQIAKQSMEEHTGAAVEIVSAEQRSVNGSNVVRGVLHANVSGIPFVFESYYYSDDDGSVQFTTWTSDNLWEKHQDEIQKLLNGFIAN